MLHRSHTRIEKAPEQVFPTIEKEPEERGPIVIEYTDQQKELLYQSLDEAQKRLMGGGVLYLTVPNWLDGELIITALRARFSRIVPLNVGSNPRLQNDDVRTRSGYMCVK